VAQTNKPDVYPKVDDDAVIILKYKGSNVVLMPSWDWSFARKDMEVYGDGGYAIAVDPTALRLRYKGEKTETASVAPELPPDQATSFGYLVAVMRGRVKPVGDYSGLDTNMVVMQILDAARRSVKEGKTVQVTPLK
jgi:glucose-fructose oxidoreductase